MRIIKKKTALKCYALAVVFFAIGIFHFNIMEALEVNKINNTRFLDIKEWTLAFSEPLPPKSPDTNIQSIKEKMLKVDSAVKNLVGVTDPEKNLREYLQKQEVAYLKYQTNYSNYLKERDIWISELNKQHMKRFWVYFPESNCFLIGSLFLLAGIIIKD